MTFFHLKKYRLDFLILSLCLKDACELQMFLLHFSIVFFNLKLEKHVDEETQGKIQRSPVRIFHHAQKQNDKFTHYTKRESGD